MFNLPAPAGEGGRKIQMKLRLIALAVWSLPLSAVSAEPLSLNDAKVNAAFEAHEKCFAEQTNALDDGISEAATIGEAVAQECKLQIVRLGLAIYADTDKDATNRSVSDLLARSPSEAALVVLRQRKQSNTGADSNQPSSIYDPEPSNETAAREQLMTGAHLLGACEAVDDEWAKCSAFIRGVTTAYRAGVLRGGGKAPYCLPERYFAFEWTADIVYFLKANSDFLTESAVSAVLSALEAKYPCPS